MGIFSKASFRNGGVVTGGVTNNVVPLFGVDTSSIQQAQNAAASRQLYADSLNAWPTSKGIVSDMNDDYLKYEAMIRAAQYEPNIGSKEWMAKAILARLKLKNIMDMKFEHFDVAKTKNDVVVVFVIANGTPTHIEDEWANFPSDTFVTQLRLLMG